MPFKIFFECYYRRIFQDAYPTFSNKEKKGERVVLLHDECVSMLTAIDAWLQTSSSKNGPRNNGEKHDKLQLHFELP